MSHDDKDKELKLKKDDLPNKSVMDKNHTINYTAPFNLFPRK